MGCREPRSVSKHEGALTHARSLRHDWRSQSQIRHRNSRTVLGSQSDRTRDVLRDASASGATAATVVQELLDLSRKRHVECEVPAVQFLRPLLRSPPRPAVEFLVHEAETSQAQVDSAVVVVAGWDVDLDFSEEHREKVARHRRLHPLRRRGVVLGERSRFGFSTLWRSPNTQMSSLPRRTSRTVAVARGAHMEYVFCISGGAAGCAQEYYSRIFFRWKKPSPCEECLFAGPHKGERPSNATLRTWPSTSD